MFIRWFVLLAIAVPNVLSLYIGRGWGSDVHRDTLLAAIAIGTNAVFYFLTRPPKSSRYYKLVAASLIATDIVLITGLIMVNGGMQSRSVILYVLPILTTATIFGRRFIYLTTTMVSVLYCAVVLLDLMGLKIPSTLTLHPNESPGVYGLYGILLFTTALFIIGTMIDFILRVLVNQEQYARKSLSALKVAQSIAKLGSWEWDVPRDQMTWSDELYRVFGVEPGLVTQNYATLLSLITPEDRPIAKQEISRALKKACHFSFDCRVKEPDGTIRYIHSDGQSLADKTGTVVKLFGTARDVTDAKLLEEARSDFVSLASHQLRTPATGVKQYLRMLQDGYAGSLTPAQDRLLQTAYESNERQLKTIDDLLHVAQIDSGKITLTKAPVDIIKLINDIVKEQEIEFRNKGQRVGVRSRFRHLECIVDEQRLRMALENIVDNARKYTPISKRVTIAIDKSNHDARIRITDQGVGIAPQDISRLFQKFSRIDNPTSATVDGSGLGLYWAARIVSLHGGTIRVDSTLGKGTTFTISLPLR